MNFKISGRKFFLSYRLIKYKFLEKLFLKLCITTFLKNDEIGYLLKHKSSFLPQRQLSIAFCKWVGLLSMARKLNTG